MKVRVLDAMMGSGKTNRLIKEVGELPPSCPVIYIAPLLSECHRFAGTVLDEDGEMVFDEDGYPVYKEGHPLIHKMFKHPTNRNRKGSKAESLLELVKKKENIVSTHALFRSLTQQIIDEIENAGYLLIIDEVLTVWEKYVLNSDADGLDMEDSSTDKEILKLIKNGFIEVDSNGLMFWQWDKYDALETYYQEVAILCDSKQLYLVNGKVVFWEYPIHALRSFNSIWIATYMFESSFMFEYLKMHDIEVCVEKFGLSPTQYKHLVSIVDDKKLNDVGENTFALSYNDIVNKCSRNEILKNNLYNFFRHKTNSKEDERLWTTYKSKKRFMSGGRYAKSWLAYSTKATNEYKQTTCVAYLVNPRPNTMLLGMLGSRGVTFDQDSWALSEMVQWVWRSAIRDEKKITLYIPSKRMRELFLKWINGE